MRTNNKVDAKLQLANGEIELHKFDDGTNEDIIIGIRKHLFSPNYYLEV